MSRKDFELIADAMKRAARLSETDNQRRGVERASASLADALHATNPRFDRARFILACL